MKAASARSSLASWPRRTTKRAPASLAATAKSIWPSPSPIATWSRAVKENSRMSPQLRRSRLSASSAPSGTSASRMFGNPIRCESSSDARRPSSSSSAGMRDLMSLTSAISASASSPLDFRTPISLEAWFRRDCMSWISPWSRRLLLSISRIVAAVGSILRRDRAASNASGFSRIRRMSCICQLVSKICDGHGCPISQLLRSGLLAPRSWRQ